MIPFIIKRRLPRQKPIRKPLSWTVRTRVLKIDIEDAQQAEKVKEFFEKHEPNHKWFREYYSGADMGMAAVKNFWLDLFEKG